MLETQTPIWGERYVDRLLSVVAPSWLAPGNLPALAAMGPVRVRFLTQAADMPQLLHHPVTDRLRAFAEVVCTPIDDLLAAGSYAVPLTLAYHRGLTALAADGNGGRGHALLLNADFVLADGSLRHAGERLLGGARALLATSLRVSEERFGLRLRRAIQADGALAVPPRLLARWAFDDLHPTVIASRADAGLASHARGRHFFWRPDRNVMISRHFLPFVLGVGLEGPPPPARSYADYDMASVVAGAGPHPHLTDSDEFMAIELGPGDQEARQIERREGSPAHAAAVLNGWTTPAQRASAEHVFIWRAGPAASPRLDEAVAASDAFIAATLAGLGPPIAAQDHPLWLADVRQWRAARRQARGCADPPELAAGDGPAAPLADPDLAAAAERGSLRKVLRGVLVGTPGQPRALWQPFWAVERALAAALAGRRVGGVVGRIGLLNHEAPLEALGAAPTPEGAPAGGLWCVGVDLGAAGVMRARLELVRESAADEVLIVATRDDGAAVSPADVAALGAAVDDWLALTRAVWLNAGHDVKAERAHGDLADRFATAPGLSALGLALRSGWFALAQAAHAPLLALTAAAGAGSGAGRCGNVVVLEGTRRP